MLKEALASVNHSVESVDRRISILTDRIDQLEANRPPNKDKNKGYI